MCAFDLSSFDICLIPCTVIINYSPLLVAVHLRIAEKTKKGPELKFTILVHLINEETLKDAYFHSSLYYCQFRQIMLKYRYQQGRQANRFVPPCFHKGDILYRLQ